MLPFALAAVAGLASVALPGPALDRAVPHRLRASRPACSSSACWRHLRHRERWLIGVLPLGYLVVAALLRHASAGSASGFLSLVLSRGLAGGLRHHGAS